MAVDWTRGYGCTWRFALVDTRTWASGMPIGRVESASYSADLSGDAVETATIAVRRAYDDEAPSGWIRIEGMVSQGMQSAVVDVGTLLFSRNTARWGGGMRQDSLSGVSSLKLADEANKLGDGAYAAKGSDAAARAAELIRAHTPAPVVVHGTAVLPETVVFDLDATPMDAAREILDKAGWIVRMDGMGRVHILEKPSIPSAHYSTAHRGMFHADASETANGELTYTRAWGLGLLVGDVFDARLPEIGLDGTYRVTKQKVTCGNGIYVEETVVDVRSEEEEAS